MLTTPLGYTLSVHHHVLFQDAVMQDPSVQAVVKSNASLKAKVK